MQLDVDPAFTKITTGPAVTDGGLSVGVAWVDCDEDDFLYLLVTNSAGTTIFFYHNERDQ